MCLRVLSFYCCFSLFLTLSGQETLTDSIELITIQSLRIDQQQSRTPISVYQRNFTETNFLMQRLSLQEYVSEAPGLFSLNASNYAQDLRISIRGFGARSAFGIRGVKLIVDGIPETTPDGQGQLDNLILSTISSLEVINGPASSIYGNASGGVIFINTLENIESNFVEAGATLGSYGLQQYSVNAGYKTDKSTLVANYLFTGLDGYRDQSSLTQHAANVKLVQNFDKGGQLKLGFSYTDSPTADDPGGINLEAVEADRQQARDANVLFQTGESINHSRVFANHTFPINKDLNLESYGFLSTRNFEGRLPFGFGGLIDLGRVYWGIGSSLTQKKILTNAVITSKVGIDFADQADDRKRFFNNEGIQGDITLDQLETFRNIGFYYLGTANLGSWDFLAGLRYDNNDLAVDDVLSGEGTGGINLSAVTYSLGINYQLNQQLSSYVNLRRSFETPSLSELSSNPSGEAGFNDMLNPQDALNYEIGLSANTSTISGNIALFYIDTSNDLVPFELEEFPDRDFFRNAGSTDRFGIELSLNYQFNENLRFTSAYSYSDFNYDEFLVGTNDFSGNRLPAIPVHQGSWRINYTNDLLNVSLQHRYIGSLFTNDSNSVEDGAYSLFNLNAGIQLPFSSFELSPFVGIRNIFNTLYNDNIRINAFGSRFFEPGPERNFYAGVKIRFQ